MEPRFYFQVERPAWIGRDGYDVEAKVAAGASLEQMRTMMQTLLAGRFHLVVRKEKRPYPCYTMTVAKNGPHLTEINPAEAAIFREDDPTPPPKTSPGQSPPIGLISTSHTPEGITMRAKMSVAELANYISNQMERPVVDLTHLAGVYDLRFTYQADQSAPGPDPGSTLVQAVEQALGLRIEAGKTPIEFIIVDRVDRADRVPTQN